MAGGGAAGEESGCVSSAIGIAGEPGRRRCLSHSLEV